METEEKVYQSYDEYFEEYSKLLPRKGKKLKVLPESYTAVELTTTGLTPDICQIVEYGAIKIRDGKEIDSFHTYAKMQQYFAEGIPGNTQVDFQSVEDSFEEKTGFEIGKLADAPDADEALRQFMAFVGSDALLVYDGGLISSFLFETAVKALHISFENDWLDCMALAKKVLKKQLPHYKLKNIAEYYSMPDAAPNDILARCRLIDKCCGKLVETLKV